MSDGINQVMLFGYLGSDPELKQGPKGPYLRMRLATNRSWTDKEKGTKEERTDWHTIKMFGRRAEALAKHLSKGTRLFIQGRLVESSYEKDGQKKWSYDVIAEDVTFAGGPARSPSMLSSSASASSSSSPPSSPNGAFGRAPMNDAVTDLPF